MKNEITRLSLVLPLLAGPAFAQDANLPAPRPFDEMRGPCTDFAMDISREVQSWAAHPPVQMPASAQPDDALTLRAGEVFGLVLYPHPDVSFDVEPEQNRGADDNFSGHARVTIPTAGLWRVAASNGLWYDVVVDGAIVPSAAFEMQTQCATPFKVVVFDLPAGEVALQFNGSRSAGVEVLVLPWSDQ